MKIKVCGMRDSDNISELVKLTPDYIGFIFYDKSKRFVANFPEVTIPKSIKKVGVFVNETIEGVITKTTKYDLQVVQLHGDETPQFCKELKIMFTERSRSDNQTSNNSISTTLNLQIEIIKAFAVDTGFDFSKTNTYKDSCDMFLFDTKGKDYGGNGLKYDWSILKKYEGKTQFLLSGGINENDVELIKEFHHRKLVGVDLNSGFEDAPAIKNIKKLKKFITNIRN
ncbi:MAG: phosphoribosylanthranilate isomerase [Flavobacteriaceae bacterium]|nr:phosphoribosylanthranilate isomerase [Flavobacteriaceae bacterium]